MKNARLREFIFLFFTATISIILAIKNNNWDYTCLITFWSILIIVYTNRFDLTESKTVTEIIMLHLTLFGLFFTFNNNIILDSENTFTPFRRIFKNENTIDFSKFTNDTINHASPHIVIALDISGSIEAKANTDQYDNIFNSLFERVQNHVYAFGGEKDGKLEEFFKELKNNKRKKSTLFKLRALDLIRLLDSLEYPGELSLILFGEYTKYQRIGTQFNTCIKYITETEKTSNSQNTNINDLFKNINNEIFKHYRPQNINLPPQYVFIFLTDFIHDPSNKINIDRQKDKISDELNKFSQNSTFANFYYFYEDTKYISDLKSGQFSVYKLIKNIPNISNKLIPIQNYNEIVLGYQKPQLYLPIYYEKPYSNNGSSNVKIIFDSLQNTTDFSICSDTENRGNDQYYFTIKNYKDKKKFIGKYPCRFSVDQGDCIEIFYQGYVPNQYPSQSIILKDLNTRKSYEIEIIFFRDFSFISKYIFIALCLWVILDIKNYTISRKKKKTRKLLNP